MRDFTLITNNSELGSGKNGASLGVLSLVTEINKTKIVRLLNSKIIEFDFAISNKTKNNDNPIAKNINEITKNYSIIKEKLQNELLIDNFNLFISGDHSTTASYLSSIKKLHKNKSIGLIWVDAHADLHSPYTTPSGNMHGMTIAISTKFDNLDFKINSTDEETLELWNKLKTEEQSVNFSDIVYIGLRDIEKEEIATLNSQNIKEFKTEEVNNNPEDVALKTLNYLKNVDLIFISFDVDCLDPNAISWGTGTPVKNGILLEPAKLLLSSLVKDKRLIGFEIVEINPLLEREGQSMTNAALQLIKVVSENVL
ncbi:MAG: arginase family protein [Candidatus Kapabacteria bacterium]|nr:arginase family protein [Candidatus Kapabacteria bacterium]